MIIKNTSRFITVTALFLLPIFALIVWHSFFFPFITGKGFYFRLLIEVAFAGWLVLACIDPKYRPKWTPMTIGVSIFTLVVLVADLLGVNPMRSLWSNFERMEGWMVILHLWGLYMVSLNIFGTGEEARRLWHRWFNFELVVAFIVCLYGIGQLMGWFAIHQGSSRIDASLGNAAYMAVYLLWNIGIAAYMTLVAKAKRIAGSKFLVWAYPALAILMGFLLFQTATRGTILGLIGGISIALLLYAILGGREARKSRTISGGVLALVIIIAISFWSLRDRPFVKNSEVLNRLASISLSNSETSARIYIWKMAGAGFVERPILGWGQENFNYIFNANYNPKLYNQEQWFDRAHSVYLDWLVASGAIGFLAYIALYVLFLVAVWKSGLSIGTKTVLTGVLAGYAIHNIFVFDNIASYILFFTFLAFAGSLREGKPVKFLGTNPVSSDMVEYVVTPAVIVALVLALYFLNIRQMQANSRLITALTSCTANGRPDPALFENALAINAAIANQEIREQLLSCATAVIRSSAAPTAVKQEFFTAAKDAIQDQLDSTKLKDARAYNLAGTFMGNIGMYSEAEKYLTVAHELSPKKQSITAELALNLINAQKVDNAIVMLKSAYEDVKENAQIKNLYALALVVGGKEAEARKLFAGDTALFETYQMGQAYSINKEYSKAIGVFKKLVAASPDDVNLSVTLAQTYYIAGDVSASIATLRALQTRRPELKDQVEATIKSFQQ